MLQNWYFRWGLFRIVRVHMHASHVSALAYLLLTVLFPDFLMSTFISPGISLVPPPQKKKRGSTQFIHFFWFIFQAKSNGIAFQIWSKILFNKCF